MSPTLCELPKRTKITIGGIILHGSLALLHVLCRGVDSFVDSPFKNVCIANSPGRSEQYLPPRQRAGLFPSQDMMSPLGAKVGQVC